MFNKTSLTTLIGSVSSFILLLSIGKQILKQAKTKSAQGISKWLFIGQLGGEVGFVIYSLLLKNWIFVITNSVLLLENVLGLALLYKARAAALKTNAVKR